MKYLDYPELESLSRALTFESAECKVFTRLEAYSCKAVKRERQLFKSLESQYLHSASLSPPKHLDETLASPFGRLDQAQARKTLFLLIATLNGAFPDHDFSGVDPADFRREINPDFVLNSLGTTLLSLRSNSNAPRSFSSFPSSYDEEDRTQPSARGRSHGHGSTSGGINHPQLGAVLDDIMCISDCEVFTFHPDTDSDPHASAEPDEEGIEVNDERYVDDESLSDGDEGYGEGQDTQMSTPKRRSSSSSFNEDAGMDDAPMFDEDLMGFGFTPVQSRISSAVTTPRTPSSTRARAGDFFSYKKAGRPSTLSNRDGTNPGSFVHTLSNRITSHGSSSGTYPTSSSYYSDEDPDEGLDDDGQGPSGLLWATYAFFYNRKLKRILFVSVWSRRTNFAPNSYSFSPPSYPTVHRLAETSVPPLSIDQAITKPNAQRISMAKSLPASMIRKTNNDSVDATATPAAASPAKRAIARTNGESSKIQKTIAGTKRRRDLSASPAPSLRSPFPHDSRLA
ncbi:hypothetical protein L7F22_050223 [Adiantum nelumboides]|nr:hypothetical protein [Adiantum nelumboides]